MLLSLENVSSGYGGIPILRDITLAVDEREILAVAGRNGVGKTTLVQTIVGLIGSADGKIVFDGNEIGGLDACGRARLGIAYVPQGRGIFSHLTVAENLQMGEMVGGRRGGYHYKEVYGWFPILDARRRQKAGTLSGGEQQMLAIARILVGAPKLLLLDEPSEGVQPNIVEQIADVILQQNEERGLTVLLVEQNLDLIYMVADRCIVLDKGAVTQSLSPEALAEPETARRYLAI